MTRPHITALYRRMLCMSGMRARNVSLAMGRFPTFISTSMHKGSYPRLDTLVKVAGICGYKVQLVRQGETITVEEGLIVIETEAPCTS